MSTDAIAKAREAEKTLRARFEMQKAKEWTEVSATAHAEVVRAIMSARRAGVPVTQIAKAYGTTNRGTIYELIREGETYETLVGPQTVANPVTVRALSDDENPEGFPNPHRVTLENGDVVDVYVDGDRVGVITTPDAQYTHDVLDKTGPVWDALQEAGIID